MARTNRLIVSLCGLALWFPGCKKDEAPAKDEAAESGEDEATEPTPVEVTQAEPRSGLLSWLDPDAASVAYWRMPQDLDPDLFSVVFALPPKVEQLLRDIADIDEGLDAILAPDAPRPESWLSSDALASASVVSSGTYVLRDLKRPAEEVKKLLVDAGLQETTVEGFTLLEPARVFPWKVAFLDEDTVAFIPAKEIGSGLSPLTAARDLPPSDLRKELEQVVREDVTAKLLLYATGPLLHLDVKQDILQLMVKAHELSDGKLDVQVMLHPSRDPEAAAKTLEQRQTPLETDQVQKLVDRVAYTVDGSSVVGRLQLTPDDLQLLRDSGGV